MANIFETDLEREGDLEEQHLDEEANRMLRMWDREELMRDVSDQYERMKYDSKDQDVTYYDGETSFAELAKDMTPVTSDTKIMMKLVSVNEDGKQIYATNTVLFDSIGYLEYNPMPFESSIHGGKPIKMDLSVGPIISGLVKALLTMREGETANLLIHPDEAYGTLGCAPLIPPANFLFYHVKIFKVWDESPLSELLLAERESLARVSFEQKLPLIEEHKNIANTYLADGQARDALVRYKAAIGCIEELPTHQLQASDELKKLMLTLLRNAAIASNRAGLHRTASKMAKRALFFDPSDVKAYYQLVKAKISLSDYSSAQHWLGIAEKNSPNSASLDQLRIQIDFAAEDERKKRDEIMKRMAKSFLKQ